jgi:hypothetical protein
MGWVEAVMGNPENSMRLNNPAATLTPTLSLHSLGERGQEGFVNIGGWVDWFKV